MAEEIRKSFHHHLDEIQHDIVRLGALVGEFIERGTEVLLTNDLKEAQRLIEADDELDALSLEIEDHCYRQLALQQPMAVDLRCLITAIRLSSEIERSGDLMVNVAKAARRLYGTTIDPKLRGLIRQMSDQARRLFALGMEAYADRDASKAAALDDMDDALDAVHKEFVESIFEAHRDSGLELQGAVQLALIARYYERIGDHAVNVGERVQYMVTGWLPEHTGVARVLARDELRNRGATADGGGAGEG